MPPLAEPISLEITLLDTDGVFSPSPQRVLVGVVEDEPPQVAIQLRGIGTAVTPDVRIPLQGTIQDDYGVVRAWAEVHATDNELRQLPIAIGPGGRVSAAIDFRALRDDEANRMELVPGEQHKLRLVVRAEDACDLDGSPNVGSGDQYELDIVTPDQLLAILEREEVGLRRRLEQIHQEMSDARDQLVRAKSENLLDDSAGLEPEEKRAAEASAESSDEETRRRQAQRQLLLRTLYVQRALLQSQKSRGELMGVAEEFENIYLQLVNNRVQAEDHKNRVRDEVAAKLRAIGTESFPALDESLAALEKKLNALAKSPDDPRLIDQARQAAETATQRADELLVALERVLEKLLKFESYAELLDIIRDLIKDQEQLIEATKEQQKKELLQRLLE